jgi:Lrp/AsnC family leucine-responsive transcriptional regulator
MLDETDVKLLTLLSQDASTTATQLMEKVNLSIPAVNKRIRKMRQSGVIRRFTMITDGEKVGKPITAFILLILQQASAAEPLMQFVASDPDVLECYAVTGEYDYIIKVCAADVKALERKLMLLKQRKGVVKSHTLFALKECKLEVSILPEEAQKDI